MISLNKTTAHTLVSGSGNTAFTLEASGIPDGVDVTFTSSDVDVATVDEDGKVETLDEDSAVITASTSLYGSATCNVYVHSLDYEDSANVSADSTYDWVFAYDDEVEPKTAIAVSNITLDAAAEADGVTATAGTYDADTGSITVEVTIPDGVVATTAYVIGAKVTVGESEETVSVTLTVAE